MRKTIGRCELDRAILARHLDALRPPTDIRTTSNTASTPRSKQAQVNYRELWLTASLAELQVGSSDEGFTPLSLTRTK